MRTRARPHPIRQGTIITQLRDSIVRGTPAPGSRLPTRVQIAKQFGTTVVTVQRALDHLAADGFVRSSRRGGTHVTPHPPHLSHYGLVFRYRPNEPESWSGLAKAVRDAAFAVERTEARRLSIYFHTGYEPHNTEDFNRLVEGVMSQTLAGLIFVDNPHRMINTPVIQTPGLPRVAIMSEAMIPGVAAVHVDQRRFFDRALNYLRKRGRRRVCIISPGYSKTMLDHVSSSVARRGMTLRPYWWQAVAISQAECATNAAHLLLHDRQRERPDAMIITDEALADHSSIGIAASGMRVGQDIDVVAHCNFPRAGISRLPLTWLGFDTDRLLHTCLAYIDNTRRGLPNRQLVLIPPRFEEEKKDQMTASVASVST